MYVCLAINKELEGNRMNAPPGRFLFSQIRTTFFWLCLNAVDQANMGFMTVEGQSPCSTACGSKNYSAGQSHMWRALDTNVEWNWWGKIIKRGPFFESGSCLKRGDGASWSPSIIQNDRVLVLVTLWWISMSNHRNQPPWCQVKTCNWNEISKRL